MIISLQNNVTGQVAGLESISRAFSIWESNKNYGQPEPLVLAIVGPTGAGKTETGSILISSNMVYLMRSG